MCIKQDAADELVMVIRAIAQGHIFLSPSISKDVVNGYLLGAKGRKHMDDYDSLTNREKEVLQLLIEGKTTNNIASMLNISIKTVESHQSNLMRKLNLKNIVDLVKYAFRKKLIES